MELIQAFQNLHFLRPRLLWLLPVALAALWWLGRRFRHRDGWSAVVDAHLLPALRVQQGGKASGLLRLAMVVFVLGILALAGPSWQKKSLPVVKNQHALVIALDLSRSMLATDIKPNRLQRAKFKTEDLLKQRKDGQTALIAWAGEAFVVTPLTDDTETIAAMLDVLDPSIMPKQGSKASKALEKAAELIRQAGLRRGDILLIADGVDTPAAQETAAQLAKHGFRIHVLGVGTADGAPIPTRSGFFTDRQGNIVIPKLDEKTLKAVADAGEGHYHRISPDDSDLRALLVKSTDLNGNETSMDTQKADAQKQSEQWVDDGIWLVLLLVPLMALLYRRGWLMMVVLAAGLHGMPDTAMAQKPAADTTQETAPAAGTSSQQSGKKSAPSRWQRLWQNLWYNKDQQAAQALQSGQAQQAAQLATDPRWKAAAEYKQGQYQQAEKAWKNLKNPTAEDWYNRGNALAKAGKLEEAIKAYELALTRQPDHADAAYNKKVVEEALKKQQQNPQDQQGQQGQKDQQDQQGQQGQKNQQDQQGQQGQKDPQDQQGQQGQKDQQEQQGQQGQQDQQDQQGQQGQKDQQDQQGKQGQQDQQGKQGQQDQQDQQDQQGQQGQKDQQDQQGQNTENSADDNPGKEAPQSEAQQQRQAQAMEEAQRQAEEKARQALAKKEPTDSQPEDQKAQAMQPVESAEEAEKQQAMEQWLRRIPDDPGGLLRRKFQYQYRQRQLNREVDRNDTEQDW